MKVSKEKVKEFCKQYGKYILIATGGAVIGGACVYHITKSNKLDKQLSDVLMSFGSNHKEKNEIIEDIIRARSGSTYMEVHSFPPSGNFTIGNVWEYVDKYYKHMETDPDTTVNGLILFDMRNEK